MTVAEKLSITTPSKLEILMTREFNAPRAMVWQALTRPELLRRWYGPRGHLLVECRIDLWVGGAWRHVLRAPDSSEMLLHGVFQEIARPDRLVRTEINADCDAAGGIEARTTIELLENDRRTILTSRSRYATERDRDAVLHSGMERGVGETYDQLSEFLRNVGNDNFPLEEHMSEITARYRAHADAFQRKVAGTASDAWNNQSPCADWTARDVVGHIVIMHGAMLMPVGRRLSPAPALEDDPLGAFIAARADVEAVLADPELAGRSIDTPGGRVTAAEHIDGVISDDMVLHGWDLARATGQDDTIDPVDLQRLWRSNNAIPAEMLERLRTPGAFGPGVIVFGPEVSVPTDSPLQDRLLGLIGRNPQWTPQPASGSAIPVADQVGTP